MRILFIEKHEIFSDIVTRQFLSAHDVRIVRTLHAARQELSGGGFDIVLLDDQLEDGRGEELVLELRSKGALPTIIGISAYDHLNAEMLRAGADAACGKLEFSQIDALIRSLQN